jgi:N-acylneuraminate cytidylyltransferase
MSNVCIIAARGGSKRIPGKNIKPFAGKPMIAWSIEAAKTAGLFDGIYVSTDSDEVAAVSESFGAEVPFRRPPELSDDATPLFPVIAHAINWLTANRGPVTFVCNVFATAPFLQSCFIREGLDVLRSNPGAEFAFGVTSYAFPVFRSVKRNPDGTVSMLWPEHALTRSQDLPEVWHEAGQFTWGRPQAFLTKSTVYGACTYPVVLPRHLVQDIDTPEDWEVAEKMFQKIHAPSPAHSH